MNFVYIALLIVFFFVWLTGKTVYYVINTTFRDWFPFLYFLYLLFFRIIPNNIHEFNFVASIVFFFFIISIYKDFFRGLRIIIGGCSLGYQSIEIFDKIKEYLFKEKLENVAEFLLATALIGFIYIYMNNDTLYISLADKSTIELLGFIVGIFSMYGIYIGFLQYLAGDVKSDTYLGRSKVNYLIRKSFWYQITQSKIFLMMLLATVIIPVAVKLNIAFTKEFTILWQTSYMLLLVIYIFLLRTSLYIIRVAFLMKSKDDGNLKNNMRRQFQREYKNAFWIQYRSEKYRSVDFIKNYLSYDINKVNENEKLEFIQTVFESDYLNEDTLYRTIIEKVSSDYGLLKWKILKNKLLTKFETWFVKTTSSVKSVQDRNNVAISEEWQHFYSYYKKFSESKWEFLTEISDTKINTFYHYYPLIRDDEKIIEQILNKQNVDQILRVELSSNSSRWRSFDLNDSILIKLFNIKCQLVTDISHLNKLIKDTEESTRDLNDKEKFSELQIHFFNELEKYKWKKLISLKEKIDKDIYLSSNKGVYYNSNQDRVELIDNSDLYSEIFLEQIIKKYNDNLYKSMNPIYQILYHLYNDTADLDCRIDSIVRNLEIPIELIASEIVKLIYRSRVLEGGIIKKHYNNVLENRLWKYKVYQEKYNQLDMLKNHVDTVNNNFLPIFNKNRLVGEFDIDSKVKELELEVKELKLFISLIKLGDMNKTPISVDSLDNNQILKKRNDKVVELINKYDNDVVFSAIALFKNIDLVTDNGLNYLYCPIPNRVELESQSWFY
ncbi:hypothetical protein [Streptococcus loxodontisalivarius]|uniref:Uncharacterized protein n=1 Tax=Streptococcus loxodontisalivarius TaxID=1349415 RepID=A0ABS2PQC0_9STRE|nr:hypothetical protein [Streptococcus loxodontisalivarius]MBM7642143.1 hypothetical protein [Streptococcus loxodontisalivarius]